MMAQDPELMADVERRIAEGSTAERGLYDAFAAYRALLANAGEYLAGRVADLDDVRNRIVARLLGVPMPGCRTATILTCSSRAIWLRPTPRCSIRRWCSVSSPRRAGRPATAPSSRALSGCRPWSRCLVRASWPKAWWWRSTAAPERSSSNPAPKSGPLWRARRRRARRRSPPPAARVPPRTGTRCRCWPTSAARATYRRRWKRARRASGSSARSSCSWTTASRRPPRRSRSRRTARCWRRFPRAGSSSGCSMPARTSRWPSSPRPTSRTRRSGCGGCAACWTTPTSCAPS